MINKIINKIFQKKYNFDFKVTKKTNKALLLGTYDSINKIDLNKYNSYFKISHGNFFEHKDIDIIRPDCHIFAGSHPPITENVSINWWTRCHNKLPLETKILVHRKDKKIAEEVFIGREIYFYSTGGQLPVNFKKNIISPSTVVIVGLQLAIYLNFEEIFLVGINHDWQQVEKYTHFYSHDKPCLEYYLDKEGITISYEEQSYPFPKEYLYNVYGLYQQYETLKKYASSKNIVIYNADPFSVFDVFKKV
ncbi:MAG: hypothetical protein AB8B78_09030 [Polaribacter sp.]